MHFAMSRSGLGWLLVAVALLLSACQTAGAQAPAVAADSSDGPKVGRPAPDLTLQLLDGTTARLSDYRGRVVLLNFWASYCPPCKAEMPAMEKVYREVVDRGGVVLAVDQGETAAQVRAFAEENALTFPIAVDEKAASGRLYRVVGIPTTFVIDREGIIRYIKLGEMDETSIQRYFSSLL